MAEAAIVNLVDGERLPPNPVVAEVVANDSAAQFWRLRILRQPGSAVVFDDISTQGATTWDLRAGTEPNPHQWTGTFATGDVIFQWVLMYFDGTRYVTAASYWFLGYGTPVAPEDPPDEDAGGQTYAALKLALVAVITTAADEVGVLLLDDATDDPEPPTGIYWRLRGVSWGREVLRGIAAGGATDCWDSPGSATLDLHVPRGAGDGHWDQHFDVLGARLRGRRLGDTTVEGLSRQRVNPSDRDTHATTRVSIHLLKSTDYPTQTT